MTEVIDCTNGSDSRKKWMKYEKKRLDSFPLWSLNHHRLDVSDARRFTRAGFYYYAFGTECFSCGLRKHRSFWLEGHDPDTVHRSERPNCEFVKGQRDSVSTDTEKWLSDVSLAQCLARAGFYRTHGDYTECFSCGLLKPSFFWWEGHDPETVHREESPNCLFVKGGSDNVPIDPQLRKINSTKRKQETVETTLNSGRPTGPGVPELRPNSVRVTVTRSRSWDQTSDPKGISTVQSVHNSSVTTTCSSEGSREGSFTSSVTDQKSFSLVVTDGRQCPTVSLFF